MPRTSGTNKILRSSWGDRIALARGSWHNQLRLTDIGITDPSSGQTPCGFWASTNYWSGWIAEVKIHDHIVINVNDPDAASQIAALIANVREACERARRDFPESVPCLAHKKDSAGKLLLTENPAERPEPGAQREFYPDDTIPIGIETPSSEGANSHIEALIAARRQSLYIEDSVNSYFGPPRLLRYCTALKWGYSLRIARRMSHGVRVSFLPKSFSTEILAETGPAELISASSRSVNRLFEDYGPGGSLHGKTPNGLPPGERSIQEFETSVKDAK